MTSSPTFRSRSRAFTLVEMLTAVTVLCLLVLLLGQSVGTMSRTWLAGQRRVNNFTKARAMLDTFARDVQSGLFRADLAAFPPSSSGPGSDTALYTQRQGISAGNVPRGVSLVQYRFDVAGTSNVAVTTLERGDLAVLWNSAASLLSFGDAADFPAANQGQLVYRSTAPGVIAFKVVFILADGTLTPSYASGTNPARAAGMTLAVVDDQTLKQLSAQQVSDLRAGFNGATDGTRNVQGDWQRYLATLNWNSYPKNLGDSLRIFARYVPLPDR